jgi:uncharacterized membrane protein YkvA (DUF1232 family)
VATWGGAGRVQHRQLAAAAVHQLGDAWQAVGGRRAVGQGPHRLADGDRPEPAQLSPDRHPMPGPCSSRPSPCWGPGRCWWWRPSGCPPGILKDLAGFLPTCLTTVRRLRNDPRVPRRAKVAILLAGLWVLSPIDLLPEFLSVIGPLDDVLVVALALRYAARSVSRPVLLDAWPADPRLLERLLGPPATPPGGRVSTHSPAGWPIEWPSGEWRGPTVRAAFGGSLSLTWLLRSMMPGEPGPATEARRMG